MVFSNKRFFDVITLCLCTLISTQQVHTKDKSNLPPLTGETCTEVPGDTEEAHSELPKDIISYYSEMRKKIDKEFIGRVKAIIDSTMRELRDKKNLALTGETCIEGPGDTEENRSELSKKETRNGIDLLEKMRESRLIQETYFHALLYDIDNELARLERERQILAKMKKISRSRIRPLQ